MSQAVDSDKIEPVFVKALVQFVLFVAYWGAFTFGPAGTLDYPEGWVLLVEIIAGSIAIMLWLARHDPSLLRERLGSPVQRTQPGWDRVFLVILMVGFTAWLAFISRDAARQSFSAVPSALQIVGFVAVAFYLWGIWVTFRANSYAAPVVKLQVGQQLIDTGPYAVVRHPMYSSALGLFIGVPLLLGSWWGLLGSGILTIAIAWRAVNEERELKNALAGYDAYMKRIPWRFVPGVW